MDEKDENIIENQAEEEKKDTTANEAPIEMNKRLLRNLL